MCLGLKSFQKRRELKSSIDGRVVRKKYTEIGHYLIALGLVIDGSMLNSWDTKRTSRPRGHVDMAGMAVVHVRLNKTQRFWQCQVLETLLTERGVLGFLSGAFAVENFCSWVLFLGAEAKILKNCRGALPVERQYFRIFFGFS